jgi:hypothetical protein
MAEIDPRLAAKIKTITAHRARVVLDHIMKHGFVTTEELRNQYGYHHPPRARMDVLEYGIPIETFRVKDSNGRSIGAYRFGASSKLESHKTGRSGFSKAFKKVLFEKQHGCCAILGEPLEERYLSIDHRVPFQVAGDDGPAEDSPDSYMLIAVWLQRVKSWSCEHCPNGKDLRDAKVCKNCFWASPESYDHIATEQRRRVDTVWIGNEVEDYKQVQAAAAKAGSSVSDWIKRVTREQAEIELSRK